MVRVDLAGDRGAAGRGRAGAAPEDVDLAVGAAREAFENGWSALRPAERAKYLFRIARILQERARELAVAESLDGGKPIKESRDVDLPLAAAHFFYYAGWADKLEYAFPNRTAAPARRRRADHPVELPAADARLEDRAGARVREHGRAQAGGDDAADRAALHGRLPPGGASRRASSTSSRATARRAPTSSSTRASTRSRSRARPRSARRSSASWRAPAAADARARRQGGEHRLRRLRARPGDRGDRQRHLLQPGSRVLRRLAAARPGVDRRAARREAEAAADARCASAIRSTRTRTSARSTRGSSSSGSGSSSRAGRRRAPRSTSRRAGCPRRATGSRRRCSRTSRRATGSRRRRSSGRCSRCSLSGRRRRRSRRRTTRRTGSRRASGRRRARGSSGWRERLRAGVVWANTFNRFDPASPFGGYKESGFGREGGRHGLEPYLRFDRVSRLPVRKTYKLYHRGRVPALGVRAARTRRRARTSPARHERTPATRSRRRARRSRLGRRRPRTTAARCCTGSRR